MEKFELVVDSKQGVITFNFDELKATLEVKMQDYTNVVYTAETVKTGKKDVAELRKLYKSLDEKRKEIKKTWNDPYKQFEDKVKELQEIINKPINEINAQIEVFEQQKLAEKKAKIQSTYDEVFAGLEEYAQLNKIYDPKWENSTTSMKSIRERMVTLQTAVSNSISTINNMKSDAVEDALKIYKNTGDLATALAHITQYENQKAEILEKQRLEEQERQRKAEEERIRKEEQAKLEAERKAEEERKQAKKRNEEMARQMMLEKQQQDPQNFDTSFTGGFVQNEQDSFVSVPTQEPTGFNQPQGFSNGGFTIQQEQSRIVTFTIRTPFEDADRLEAMLNTWGFTDFDRR